MMDENGSDSLCGALSGKIRRAMSINQTTEVIIDSNGVMSVDFIYNDPSIASTSALTWVVLAPALPLEWKFCEAAGRQHRGHMAKAG